MSDKARQPTTVTVVAPPDWAGNTVNLPHSEHAAKNRKAANGNPRNTVTFDDEGKVEVSPETADALVEFYGNTVRRV